MEEIWKDIPGYEGRYMISDHGKVKSLARMQKHPNCGNGFRRWPEKILKWRIQQRSTQFGKFARAWIWLCKDGKAITFDIPYLVLITFVCPRPDGLLACHEDGNPLNNFVGNLRWDTQSGNLADRDRHGTNIIGEHNGQHKLTVEQVKEIIDLYRTGNFSCQVLGDRFGVSNMSVHSIVTGKSWSKPLGKKYGLITV